MKRNKSMLIGLACGLCCMACVGLYTFQVGEEAAAVQAEALTRYGGEQVEVCVARRDIAAGETVSASDVETKVWIASLLPEGAASDPSEVVGQQVNSAVLSGEVMTKKRLGSHTSVLEVPDGLVAVSVPARDVQAVGGALSAGMRTDVYAAGSSETAKIVSQALVLETSAQGSEASQEASARGSVSWVTLAVEPKSISELVSAAQNAELYFALPVSSSEAAGKEER